MGKLTVITRKAIGPAYVFMGSKDLGADLAYAWPTAEIAVTQASQAALAIYGEEATPEQETELAEQFLHPMPLPSAVWLIMSSNPPQPAATSSKACDFWNARSSPRPRRSTVTSPSKRRIHDRTNISCTQGQPLRR